MIWIIKNEIWEFEIKVLEFWNEDNEDTLKFKIWNLSYWKWEIEIRVLKNWNMWHLNFGIWCLKYWKWEFEILNYDI